MANITLEAVEAVMEQAGAGFAEAKQALVQADGSVEAAVLALTKANEDEPVDAAYTQAEDAGGETEASGQDSEGDASEEAEKFPVDELMEKLKALVKSGNVDRIVVRRKEDVLLNIPVNVGLVGSVIGLAAAPWAVIAAAVAAFGFSCKVEIVKKDGTKEEV